MSNILVVDDDANINKVIVLYLEKEGHKAYSAYDGKAALKTLSDEKIDLVILDIMMPVMDGWDTLKEVRKSNKVPVIMLSAKGETFDKVLALELGADDYIVKPFEPKELLARVRAVIRRTEGTSEAKNEVVSYDGILIDISDYRVELSGKVMEMPPKEIELLYFLASRPNKVFYARTAAAKRLGLRLFRRFQNGGRACEAHSGKDR